MMDVARATAPDHIVVVQAAAGTGKTWLLASRILRLLLAGAEPGAILAITFTRKAASEIHERVSERLLALAAADEDGLTAQLAAIGAATDAATRAAARGLYEKHLGAIHPLRTTTFHAFCQEILRRFPLEAEVPPGFELVESTAELEQLAWLALDRRAARDGDGALATALDTLLRECGGVHGTRTALDDFLAHRSDWWAYTEDQPDPVEFAATRLAELLELKDSADALADFLRDADTRRRIARYAELLSGHATATGLRQAADLTRALSETKITSRHFELIRGVLLTKADEPRKLKRSEVMEKKLGPQRAGELAELHQELAARVLAAIAAHKRHWTWRVSRAWYVCGAALLEEFQRLKLERGVLDFADLEWMTCRLLNRSRHAEWVQYKLDQRIDHLLVDEFQDTNPTQWRLLLPLLQEMVAGDPERRRSAFLVGDEKQSVYRFRRADPRLFHAARRWLEEHAQTHTLTQHLSRRSSPAVIRFVNLVFHRPSDAEAETEDDYPLRDFQPHDTHHAQLWGRAELLPLVRRGGGRDAKTALVMRNPLEQPRQTEEDRRHREEGDLIAGKIREILGRPIADGERVRPLTGDDIMILLRDRAHARAYEEALRRAGIPYIGTGRGSFLQSLEVRDLMQLLRHLVEPYNDLALATALRSPLFAASEDDLLRLAQSPPGSWRDRLERLPDPAPAGALARARQLLPRWRALVGRLPVHDLLDRIYCEGNVMARYLAAAVPHLRSRVEANLNRFLELALEVDSGRYPSLAHFLAWLERQAERDDQAPAQPAWNRAPRVRLLTIHAAKGLEAPVVFLADAARTADNRDHGLRPLVEWPAGDVRPSLFHLAGGKRDIDDVSQRLRREQQWSARREEANLLYVALTRARQMLYVSGCEPGQGGRGWYGFIEKRLRHAAASGEAQRVGLKLDSISLDGEAGVFNTCAVLEFGTAPALPPPAAAPAGPGFRVDPRLTRPLAALPEVAMLNPSQLAREDDEQPDEADDSARARRPPQRRGVAIHRMLEQLTGNRPRATIEKQMRREFADLLGEAEFDRCWREACAVVEHGGFRGFFDPVRYHEARNEIPVLYREQERDVYGVIDRLVLREDEVVLIDYKTHARATRDNIARLAQDYREQMRQYGEGARRLWPGRKLRLVLLFTACAEAVELTNPEL